MAGNKPVLLTGDTPTGALHLGHYVGSIENRLALQDDYQCFFLLANTHAFSTHCDRAAQVRDHVRAIALDYLACGIDPAKSSIFIESDVPAIYELTAWFSMIVPFPRLMRNPTIKDEIRDKQLGISIPLAFCYTLCCKWRTYWRYVLKWCRWAKISCLIWN